MKDSESKWREVLSIHIIYELSLSVAAHVQDHYTHSGETTEEEQLESAHTWVPCSEKLACNQVIRREDSVQNEVQDGHLWIVLGSIFVQ